MNKSWAFLACAALSAFPTTTMADPVALKDAVPRITTSGHARAEVVPDQADLRLGVINERPTAEAASEATATAAAKLIAEIKAIGIEPREIKTSFELEAQYDELRDDRGRLEHRTLRGYLCKERIIVRLHDISKAGALARTFIENGANEFQGITFSYSKETEARNELKAKAIRDARSTAKVYTDATGLRLGRVLQIGSDEPTAYADMPSRVAPPVYVASAQVAVIIPTEPGVQTIEESISAIWEIEGKAP